MKHCSIALLVITSFFGCTPENPPVSQTPRQQSDSSYAVNEKVYRGYRGDTVIVRQLPSFGNSGDTIYLPTLDSTKNGKWTFYYDKEFTRKWIEAEFVNGIMLGLVTGWYPNGNKQYEYHQYKRFHNGYTYHRSFERSYYPSGKLRNENFENRYEMGWSENGNISFFRALDDYANTLFEKSYYENGKPMRFVFRKNMPPDRYQPESDDDVNYTRLYWDSLGNKSTKEEYEKMFYVHPDSSVVYD